jgi:type II secretory pathway pseudopilin PulG
MISTDMFANNDVRGVAGDGEHAGCVRSQGDEGGEHARGARSEGVERGFTLIDVMIATMVMMVGVLSLMLAMTTAIVSATNGQQQAQAKQYAQSTMESIFSARDINNPAILAFNNIENVSGPNTSGGIFLSPTTPVTLSPIYNSTGCDGIIGTADDKYGTSSCVNGAPTNTTPITPIPGFYRSIVINALSFNNTGVPTVLAITVTIYYESNNQLLSQSLTSYMGNYNTAQIAGAVPSPTP